ncbi:hypothetical protein [Glycomyces tarimensis]
MSALGELLAKVAADKELVADLAARAAATKQAVEDAKAKASEIGAEDVAAGLARVEAELEQVESGRTVLEGSLEKARFQVEAAISGTGLGAPSSAHERLAEHHPDGLDVMPPHERLGRNPTGEQLMGKDPSVGPFQKEHENANSDKNLNPFARGARSAVRNSGDFKDGLDALSKPAFQSMQVKWDPPADNYYPTVGVAEPISTYTAPQHAQADLQNPVGNLFVVAVLVADWAARGIRKWKGNS